MSILIPGTEPGVLEDIGTIRTYNPVVGAYEDCERAMEYDGDAWREVWPDDQELVIFSNGSFKNLPGNWEMERGNVSVDILDGGLLKFQGSGAVYNELTRSKTIDLSEYTKMYIDVVETDATPSYTGATINLIPYGRWGLRNTMLGGVEIPFDEFQRTEDLTGVNLDKVYFGLYCNYSYYAVVRKISFLK